MDFLKDSFLSLNDSRHVAEFQRMCGVLVDKETFRSYSGGTCMCETASGKEYSFVENNCHVNSSKQVKTKNHMSNGSIRRTHRETEGCEELIPGVDLNSNEENSSTVPFKITNKLFYYFFKLVSFCGSEPFYFIFYPFCIWNIDLVLARKVGLLWGLSLYIGGAGKDYFCWPRPRSPPVAKLELTFSEEFAMPSTHTLAGTAIYIGVTYLLMCRYQVPVIFVSVCGLMYPILIALSRLYLGVHGIVDLVCGFLTAVVLCFLLIPFLADIDWYLQISTFSPVIVVAVSVALCTVFYPTPKYRYNTKGDTVQVVGAIAGFYLGAWLNYQSGLTIFQEQEIVYSILTPTMSWFLISTLRFVSGLVVLVLLRTVVKTVAIRLMSCIIEFSGPPGQHPIVSTVYKSTSFAAISLGIMSFVPYMHLRLGIVRSSFYSEML